MFGQNQSVHISQYKQITVKKSSQTLLETAEIKIDQTECCQKWYVLVGEFCWDMT